jgi:hypothetical protein
MNTNLEIQTIDLDTLNTVSGGAGFDAQTAFRAVDSANRNGKNPNIHGRTVAGDYEVSVRGDNGESVACTRMMFTTPVFSCTTK